MASRIFPASVSTLSIFASFSSLLLLLAPAHRAPVSADPSDSLHAPPIPVQAPAEPQPERSAIDRRHRMDAVRNWGYWLSSFGIAGVAVAPHDLLVIDSEISADRTFEREI